jgi:hypothetical protein
VRRGGRLVDEFGFVDRAVGVGGSVWGEGQVVRTRTPTLTRPPPPCRRLAMLRARPQPGFGVDNSRCGRIVQNWQTFRR